MKEKRGLVTSIYWIIIAILVIILGIIYYFGVVKNNKKIKELEAEKYNAEIKNNQGTFGKTGNNKSTINEETSVVEPTEMDENEYIINSLKSYIESIYTLSMYRTETSLNLIRSFAFTKNGTDGLEKYCYYGMYGIGGDAATWQFVESNYKQYEDKTDVVKYSKPINIEVANIHESADWYGAASLEEILKRQVTNGMDYAGNKIGKEGYYKLTGMLLINGNYNSAEEWFANARAKKIKVTIDDTKEYTFELKDTVDAQLIDIEYTHNGLDTPINMKIEVLETYPGDKSNDVYISDLKFGTTQSFVGGR